MSEKLSGETINSLRNYRTHSAVSKEALQVLYFTQIIIATILKLKDNVYMVQSLLAKRKDEFLVEWFGFPKSEATWEKSKNIPTFIMKVI